MTHRRPARARLVPGAKQVTTADAAARSSVKRKERLARLIILGLAKEHGIDNVEDATPAELAAIVLEAVDLMCRDDSDIT